MKNLVWCALIAGMLIVSGCGQTTSSGGGGGGGGGSSSSTTRGTFPTTQIAVPSALK